MMALKAGELPGPQGQIELFRQHALGNFRNLLVEVAKDPAMLVWLDGRTNTRAAAAGELRPRDHGAVHVRRRQLHRAGRVRRRPRVHRLEPARRRDRRSPTIRTPITSSSTTRTSTTRRRRRSRSRSTATADDDSGARRPPTACRTASTSSPRWRAHPETARRLARKLWNFFVSELEAPDPAFVEAVASVYLQNDTEMKPVIALHPAVALVPRTRPSWYTRYSWPVEFVVRAIRGGRLGRLLGRHGADAADQHGADAVRAARRRPAGSSGRAGSRPARCWRA